MESSWEHQDVYTEILTLFDKKWRHLENLDNSNFHLLWLILAPTTRDQIVDDHRIKCDLVRFCYQLFFVN